VQTQDRCRVVLLADDLAPDPSAGDVDVTHVVTRGSSLAIGSSALIGERLGLRLGFGVSGV
jgi:hypothetical protein